MYIIVGLGNPGEEYTHTRHNTGRVAAEFISKSGNVNAKFIVPNAFMNKSGPAIAKAMAGKKTSNLIVVYDDIDLPLGTLKISFNRSSGGHRGVESIIRTLKTESFIRIRIGITPTTPTGKIKKPKGEREVERYILGKFKKSEEEILKKVFKRVVEAVQMIIAEGREKAMTRFN